MLENETSLRGTVTFTKRDLATDYYGDAEAIEALPTDVTHGKFSNSGEVDLAIANSGDGRMVIINGPLFADRAMPVVRTTKQVAVLKISTQAMLTTTKILIKFLSPAEKARQQSLKVKQQWQGQLLTLLTLYLTWAIA